MPYGDLQGLSPENRQIIRAIIRGARKHPKVGGYSPRERRKAINTGLAVGYTESRWSNPSGGDRDSAGWRQERQMYYDNPTNIKAAVDRFYDEYDADAPKNAPLGVRAQAVQQSGTPNVWDTLAPLADRVRREFSGKAGGAGRGGGTRRGGGAGGSVETTQPTLSRTAGQQGSGGSVVDLLAQALSQKPSIQSAGLQMPDFAAGPVMPGGYQPIQPSPAVVDDSLDDALMALGALRGAVPGRSRVTPGQVKSTLGPAKARAGKQGGARSALSDDALFDVQKDGWKGARSVGIGLVRLAAKGGLESTSEKRATVNTASGNVSDHYEGNEDSYAWDMVGSTQELDRMARKLAKQLGVKWGGGSWLNVNKKVEGRTYRFQLGWRVAGHAPGDTPHLHMGVDRVDTPG